MKSFSRGRRLLLLAGLGSAATLGIAGATGFARYRSGRAAWIEGVIRNQLPGQPLDETALQEFCRMMSESVLFEPERRRWAVAAAQGFPGRYWLPEKVEAGIDGLEREVLTEFLLGSGYFRMSRPGTERLAYAGVFPACGNPFAVFRPGQA